MFDMPWLQLCWPDAPIEPGVEVAVLTWHFGFWSLNIARIVYVFDESASGRRFGFAYGTLPEHSEVGEERFGVSLDPADQSVWFEIFAFSRPKWIAAIGYPISRALQRRFAVDSLRAMRRAVSSHR
jgi:uncharacterized protein (UPF0548 family)